MSVNVGFLNQIWNQVYGALQWFSSLQFVNNQTTVQQAAQIYATMQSGADMIDAAQLISSLSVYINNMQNIQFLPVNLGSAKVALTSRQFAAENLQFLLKSAMPTIPTTPAAALLGAGSAALPAVDFLTPLSGFLAETYSGTVAQNISDWQSILSSLQVLFGNNLTNLYDTVAYTLSASIVQSGLVVNGGINPSGNFLYNQTYALPVCFSVANIYTNSFYDASEQQAAVMQNALRAIGRNISELLLVADSPSQQTQVYTTYVRGNESLQDIANRTLQNFEQWPSIGNLNGVSAGTFLTPGQELVLPPTSLPSGVSYSYNVNVLGRDINLGPTSGTMPMWTGDFSTISGPDNLLYALGRRLLTTLGTYIYDRNFGSRIPPEVGAVQSVGTMQHIAAFGVSSLQSDPRVQQVFNAGVSGTTSGYGLVSFQATVQPIGPQSAPVQLNQVIA